LVVINDGKIIASGKPDEVLTKERIVEVFEVEPTFVPIEGTGVHLVFD
jgi:ABC-type cobalamin/Fe3+-siderophores transport system ATPase subunit